MPVFQFRARDQQGRVMSDYIEAPDSRLAAETIQNRGWFILSVEQKHELGAYSNILPWLRHIPARDVVAFSRQLAVMAGATIPLVQALRTLVQQTTNVHLKTIASRLADDVSGGSRLSQAMSAFPWVFNTFFINMVRAGEVSGRLDETLNFLADQQEKDYDLMTKIKGAMMYPAFVIGGIVVVGFIMMVFVLPKLTEMVSGFGGQLPLATRLLIITSTIVSGYWYLLVAAAVAVVAGWFAFVRSSNGRAWWDRQKLILPVMGPLMQRIYLVRLTRGLATLLAAGIPLTQALSVAAEVVGNVTYANLLKQTVAEVEEGRSVTILLAKSEIVPAMIYQMMAVGEQTGQLDGMLDKVSNFYAREVEVLVQNLVRLIEPAIIVLLGVAVGFVVAAVILPIFNLATQL